MKYLKRAQLVLIFLMAFASAPVCPVATETRITEIENIYVKNGDKVSISARGQLNMGAGWTDIHAEYLDFTVSDNNSHEMFNKREKMLSSPYKEINILSGLLEGVEMVPALLCGRYIMIGTLASFLWFFDNYYHN